MLSKILNNITYDNIFYYIFIISTILLIIKKLNLDFNIIIYILIILALLYIYNIYILEEDVKTIDENKYINIGVDILEYKELYNILQNLGELKEYNSYTYNEILRYVKLFFNTDQLELRIAYKTEIINNLTSMIITIPIHLDKLLYSIIRNIDKELKKYIHISDLNYNKLINYSALSYNKNFTIY